MKKLLIISNGHGEDLIGAKIAQAILDLDHKIAIDALPIVGQGKPYLDAGITTIGPKKDMPSGGFFYQSFFSTIKDLCSGLIGHAFQQLKTVWSKRNHYDFVFGIGDIVPIVLCSIIKAPFMFHGSAKTAYYKYNYTPWEKLLLRRNCLLTFPRDQKTFKLLMKAKIKQEYVGNPMMDCLTISGQSFKTDNQAKVIALLPGSRADAYKNLEDLDQVALAIRQEAPNQIVEFLVALAKNLDPNKVPRVKTDWKIVQGKFGDVLNNADLVVGLSGTGNEQAVGLGKPLLAFPSRGTQHTIKFARMKQQLFGEAAKLLPREPKVIAKEAWHILDSPQIIQRVKQVGLERMGQPGAVKKMAARIIAAL